MRFGYLIPRRRSAGPDRRTNAGGRVTVYIVMHKTRSIDRVPWSCRRQFSARPTFCPGVSQGARRPLEPCSPPCLPSTRKQPTKKHLFPKKSGQEAAVSPRFRHSAQAMSLLLCVFAKSLRRRGGYLAHGAGGMVLLLSEIFPRRAGAHPVLCTALFDSGGDSGAPLFRREPQRKERICKTAKRQPPPCGEDVCPFVFRWLPPAVVRPFFPGDVMLWNFF